MTTYAIAFNLYSILVSLACILLALRPVRKPCKENLALNRFNRVYEVRCANAAYARTIRKIKATKPISVGLKLAHLVQAHEQGNYGHTTNSKLAIAKHQARLAVIEASLTLAGYYDDANLSKPNLSKPR